MEGPGKGRVLGKEKRKEKESGKYESKRGRLGMRGRRGGENEGTKR